MKLIKAAAQVNGRMDNLPRAKAAAIEAAANEVIDHLARAHPKASRLRSSQN